MGGSQAGFIEYTMQATEKQDWTITGLLQDYWL